MSHLSILQNSLINLADFARFRWWTGTERHNLYTHDLTPDTDGLLRPVRDPESGVWQLGLEWDEPRDIRQVVVRFAGDAPPDLRAQYWQNTWPTPAPERRPGARRGWIGRDDPWHGRWVTVRAETTIARAPFPSPRVPLLPFARVPVSGTQSPPPGTGAGATITFTFDPVDLPELRGVMSAAQLEEAAHYLAPFRRTLKLRLVCGGDAQPIIAELGVYSDTRWDEGEIDVRCIENGKWQMVNDGWQAVNGEALSVTPIDAACVRLRVRYADCGADSADRTILTLHDGERGFSFRVADLDRGPIYIKDYGAYITWAGGESFEAYQRRLAGAPKPIYDRIFDEPEQSLARALAEIPPLDVVKQDSYTGLGRYLPLSLEAGRQEFALRHNGELFADKTQLKLSGRDAARLLWPGAQLRFRFGTGDPPDFREPGHRTAQSLLDGWLPVVISRWLDREIEVEETAFVAQLEGPMTGPDARRGDEDVVAMLRFVLCNTTHGRKQVHFWLAIAPQEQLEVCDELILAQGRVVPDVPVARAWRVDAYPESRLRGVFHSGGRGTLAAVPCAENGVSRVIPTAILYTVELDGGESHTLTMTVPFVTLSTDLTDNANPLKSVQSVDTPNFDEKLVDVVAYWRGYVESGGQMDVPDAVLSDFHKAARVHVGISVDKEPENGLYVVPAGTWSYGACGNEATWQITMLDQAGHHDRAAAYLETFLQTQGIAAPDGKFTAAEGALVAVNFDGGAPVMGSFAYNLDHGYIMECLAHHYRYTADRTWLDRVTPNLIAACDFVIRERESTKQRMSESRSIRFNPENPVNPVQFSEESRVAEWGLLPAGHLEDNPEWRHWFTVNAHAYAGLRAIADVLASVDHPEAARLTREADAYRQDIRQAALRAMVESPVVRLLDGTYSPHIPTRTGIRGREWGWFREAAYGALHLLEGGVFAPDEPEMTWVLKDLEDNLFVSREWGRPVDLEKFWFSHGGVTIQPNLMDLGIDYLRRGQIKHALRALFNNFGSELYPDVRTFTEHPVTELGHGVGPFYKSPDESKALVWLRHFLLHEEGDALHLALGAPRAWFAPGQSFGARDMASFFGPVTYRVQTRPTEVTVDVELSDERPPRELHIHVRLPEGQVIKAVTVSGQPHADFKSEVIRIAKPSRCLMIVVTYTGA
ncbi:MAG TPA: hypothetical protein PKZ84_08465 [Anaerolineae bacterium]|nr:hypothetical protein [Anaerolineae bacterium]HQI84415.1 hypothetical protein [Anaerolineae bacterium]